MPLYDIEHVVPLSAAEQAAIAQAFTDCHAQRFTTPKFFINVRFTNATEQPIYRGGILCKYNRAILRTRAGGERNKALYNEHCKQLVSLWNNLLGTENGRELETVWVQASLTTAVEAGIARPGVCQSC